MEARELMTSPVITTGPESTIGQAAQLMLDRRLSCLPVVSHDDLVGILTHFDFGLHHRYHPLTDNLYTLLGATATPAHIEELSLRVRTSTTVAEQELVEWRYSRGVEVRRWLSVRMKWGKWPGGLRGLNGCTSA